MPQLLADLLTEDLPAPAQLAGAVFPLRGSEVALVFGEPGIGKSFLALECAVGCAVHGGSALVVAGEGGRWFLRERLVRVSGDRLGAVAARLHLAATTTLGEAELIGWVRTHRPALVVVDPVAAFIAGDENAAADAGDFMAVARALADEGAAVLLVHHAAKGARRQPRGSGAFAAAADVVVAVSRTRDARTLLRSTKVRDGEPFAAAVTLAFERRDILVRVTVDGPRVDEAARPRLPNKADRLLAIIARAGSDGLAVARARRDLRVSGATLERLLTSLEDRVEKRPAARGRGVVLHVRKEPR